MDFKPTDIFTFDPEYIYEFHMVDGAVLTGALIDAMDNGIILNEGWHIPTDKIVFFKPCKKIETN